MNTQNDNTPDEDEREESDDTSFDFWSDEGAKRFNEALDEGEAYARGGGSFSGDPEDYRRTRTANTAIQNSATPKENGYIM